MPNFTHLTIAAQSIFSPMLPAEDLRLPQNFKIEIYASEIKNARQMALGGKGTLFVGSRGEGKVYALIDKDGDYKVDEKYVIAENLNMPSGIAFRDGSLYVAAVNKVLRYDNIESKLSNPPKPAVVTDKLPRDSHHGWKYILFGPDGYLYVPVGMPCNVCLSPDERHGTILKMNVKTGNYEIYAKGVRNSVGFDWHPKTKQLWFTDNGRDWMGDDLPPDELNHASKSGLNFGFPYIHGKNIPDPDYGEQAKPDLYTKPAFDLGAHVAPLGMVFYTGKQFPKKYKNNIFIAEHGSWNRSEKTGYRVISVRLDGNRVESVQPFVTGWLQKDDEHDDETSWGRPVDIINLPDGSVLISDDYADVIYRVSYSGEDSS